jgi:hypothetical protein
VLTDFGSYPACNPFVTAIAGKLREGARLRARIEPPARSAMTFRPTVVAVVRERELRWLGRVLVPGLFDGEHALRLEGQGPGRELPLPPRRAVLRCPGAAPRGGAARRDATRRGFEAMNAALRARVEI